MVIQRCQRQPKLIHGFSLIELLVIIFIIGLAAGMVMLQVNIGNDDDEAAALQKYAEDVQQLAALAEDQAVLSGLPYGLIIEPPNAEHNWQLQWRKYQRGEWNEAEEVFTVQSLPQTVELVTEVEGNTLEFNKLTDDDKPRTPSIVFYPGGEVTPFTMTYFNATAVDQSAVLSSEATGRVEIIQPDQVDNVSFP